MKSYVATTGVVFALLAGAHICRVMAEGIRVIRNPWFVATTLLAAALCSWALILLRLHPRK